ncbi:MAG: DME family drug/metabolite transporter [Verrucomicrobiales bacterium]|jgi:DME family drug/metabolite transporter
MSTDLLQTEREIPGLTHLQGSLIVLTTGVFFSFGGLAFRSVDIGSWEYLFFRGLGMGSVAAVVLGFRYRHRFGVLVERVERLHIMAGLILGAINILFIVSLGFASVAFVLLLQTLAPIAAAYFSWLIMGERPSSSVLVATAISLIGVVVMVGGSISDELSLYGLLAVLIPIGFGLYTTLVRSAQRIDAMVPLLVAGAALLMIGIIAVVIQGGFDASRKDAAIGIFAGSALLAIPLAAFNMAQRVVSSPEATLLIMTEVILAPLWVWVFVDEEASASTVVGGAIVLVAVIWVTLTRVPKKGRRAITSRG